MKKIFTFLIAIFAISLAKAGTFGMGDYVWKDDATQNVLKTNDSYVKNDRKAVDLEMALGMWTFFETQGQGNIVLQYARGNANGGNFIAGAGGTTQAQSPNYSLTWVDITTDSLNKDWVLARNFSSLTEGDYTPSGLTDYADVGAYQGTDPNISQNIVDFGGKAVTSSADGSVTLDGTQVNGFVSGDYNYLKGALKFAIMPGAQVLADSVYSFRLYCKTSNWDGETRGTEIAERTINFNTFEASQNRIKTNAPHDTPDPVAVNGGNHFDHGMPIIVTGPDILTNVGLSVKWSAAGLQASVVKGQIVLSWGTATEINNSEFIVQRSVNGANSFVDLGKVASKSEGGYSTSALNYSFTDAAAIAKAIYRIAQVDRDGKVSYSNSVVVSLNNTNDKLSVFPNPVVSGGFLNVKGAAAGSIYRIVSINGINVAKGVISSSNKVSVNNLASGVYVLQVAAQNGSLKSVMFVKK